MGWTPLSRRVASVLLALSGFAALMYETAWTRVFEALLGHTAGTTATVIAGFLGGMTVGALLAGRLAGRLGRPLRAYGLVELAVVAWVVALPTLIRGVDRAGAGLLGPGWAAPGPGDAVRWIAGFVLVMIPATGLGATLPLVVAAVGEGANREGWTAGVLYAANTAGAVVGTLAAGFLSLRFLGVKGTLLVGAAAGVLAGVVGLLVGGKRAASLGKPEPVEGSAPHRGWPLWIGVVLVLSGVASIADEVFWLRLFVFPLGGNILTFATVVGALLAAVALGSWLGGRLAVTERTCRLRLGWAELALGLGAFGTLAGFTELRWLLREAARAAGGGSLLASLPGRAVVVAVLVGLPGIAMGAVLPLAIGASGRVGRSGAASGFALAALSAGNVAGALLAGYVLMPLVGITPSLAAAAVLPSVVGLVLLVRWGGWGVRLIAAVVTVGLVVGTAIWGNLGVVARVASVRDPHARLLDVLEGVQGTITVSDVPGLPVLARNRPPERIGVFGYPYRLIAADAVQVAGTAPDLRTTQKLQADVPLLLHEVPGNVLQIGYGSGETAAEALLHDPASVTVVELNPDIVRMAHRWFPQFERGGLVMQYTDAKLAVRTARRTWDVILNDSTYPGMAGSSQLYSLEHFQACRRHLAPGGIVSTWLPVDLPPETFRTVLATFFTVFPRCSFWLAPVCLNKHGVLVGAVDGEGPMVPVPEGGWPHKVRASLAGLGIESADGLVACRVLDAAAIRRLAAGVPVNSDEHPVLEFPARGVRVSGMDFWAETLDVMLPEVDPPVHRDAVRLMLRGQAALLAGRPDKALARYAAAGEAWPESPWPINLRQGILANRAQHEFAVATVALERGDRETALVWLGRCLELEPDSAAANEALGRTLLGLGRWAEAAAALERARLFALDPSALDLPLADALRFAGQPGRAERLYRRALDRTGPRFELLAALSDAVDRQGRLGEAVEWMQRAVRLAPDREDGVVILANLLLRQGRRDEAVELLRRSMAAHRGWQKVRRLLLRIQSAG